MILRKILPLILISFFSLPAGANNLLEEKQDHLHTVTGSFFDPGIAELPCYGYSTGVPSQNLSRNNHTGVRFNECYSVGIPIYPAFCTTKKSYPHLDHKVPVFLKLKKILV